MNYARVHLARSLVLAASMPVALAGIAPLAAFGQTPSATTIAPSGPSAPVRALTHWNLPKAKAGEPTLAIQGYDPVAYFQEGGGQAKAGDRAITTNYQGVTYRFASTANRDKFLAEPEKFEPAYGGWCAWAMKDGEKVEVDPKAFIVQDGRLFLFYNGTWANTRTKWLKLDHAKQASQADGKWSEMSGESPRGPKAQDATPMGMPLALGERAPDFTLPDAKGEQVSLAAMLAKGPVVLTWYRGGWCPYCNAQLREYEGALADMRLAGARMIAISPQTPDNSLNTSEKNELTFAVLSDQGNKVAKEYGIAYTLPAELVARYKGKLDLAKYNADDSNQLPITATYVIDREGVVRYAFVDEDYTKRAPVLDIIAALKAIH